MEKTFDERVAKLKNSSIVVKSLAFTNRKVRFFFYFAAWGKTLFFFFYPVD